MAEILVLGAGIVGVSCALALQRRGHTVTLVDKGIPCAETSFGNAGIISVGSLLPPNTSAVRRSIFKLLSNRLPHVAMPWRKAHHWQKWGWRTWREMWQQSTAQANAKTASALAILLQDALQTHQRLMAEAGLPASTLRRSGWMKLYRQQLPHAEIALYDEYGIGCQQLTAREVHDRQAGLSDDIRHGLLITDTCSVHSPWQVGHAYFQHFQQLGGQFVAATVQHLNPNGDVATSIGRLTAPHVVVALGPWAADMVNPLIANRREQVRMFHERGQNIAFAQGSSEEKPPLHQPLLDADYGYVLTPQQHILPAEPPADCAPNPGDAPSIIRMTSGVELAHRDAPIDTALLSRQVQHAKKLFPLGKQVGEVWTGARPSVPSGVPWLSKAPPSTRFDNASLWFAFGHGHIGFTLGPISGETIANAIERNLP